MRAALTTRASVMEVVDRPEPASPGLGEVVVRPQTVGICGSDFHIFLGELGPRYFPRVQGHELCAVVDEVGPGCEGVEAGDRVAIWPIVPCGKCYACSIGREAVCAQIRIVGVHFDGGLQERLLLPVTQVVPVGDMEPAVAAMIEPVSIAVRTVARARISSGEHVAVLGAGPIGQAVALVARERGASVLLVDRIQSRLDRGAAIGADGVHSSEEADVAALAREWAGAEGPPVVIDATGDPGAIRSAVEMVAGAGRVVIAGISHKEVSLPIGAFTAKELDMLGTSCCSADEFREAARIVAARSADVQGLITHEFGLESAPEAIAFAIENPEQVMKVVVRVEQD
jgi:L-gulonate 5-dehydrogenase